MKLNKQPKSGTIKRRVLKKPKTPPKPAVKPTRKKKSRTATANANTRRMRPVIVHKERKKLEKSTNKSQKMRITALLGSMIKKGRFNENNSNSNNNLYGNNQPFSYSSMQKKTNRKYPIRTKRPAPKIKVNDHYNKNGLRYMDGVNTPTPPKKTVSSRSKLGQ